MLEAWRIVKSKHAATAFTGEGAALFGGRWNSRGVAVVYTSATRSLAALETLVHFNPPVQFSYQIFGLRFREELLEKLAPAQLPTDWRAEPPTQATMRLVDRWVREGRSAVLAVPSAIIPEEANYLLNPAHRDFKRIQIGEPEAFAFDARLL
jgi:RES domain-containing protein